MEYRVYPVSRSSKEPLLQFMLKALKDSGCRILQHSPPTQAPFRITFETPAGERLGILAYAFFANSKRTKNRPADEHRFQVKYGPDDKRLHSIWQDPYLLYTTLFCGIDPERGIFVGADPALHHPTRFFISIEFKDHHVDTLQKQGWHSWERDHRAEDGKPVEVLVGGTAQSFLRYVRFEREALYEDQGHRQFLAERVPQTPPAAFSSLRVANADVIPPSDRVHALAREFQMEEGQVLDLIANARRLKMAVRGWVAEEHLVRRLRLVPGVTDCERDDAEGRPDVRLRFEGSRIVTIECKNVLRKPNAANLARVDFQRTRAAKGDPCSRYYSAGDFDVVAACLHAVTEKWEFRYVLPRNLESHSRCPGKLASNVRVDDRWNAEVSAVLRAAV
ncbi:hypothetical protein [Corallococcus sicarius]|uniref:hypothetical protein n=1 Tax=Corallococcus sicarius TaxID=2316726 RepID=UPI0011C4A3AC|nr:hypothetical protein [Corallococcus sicarius]